MFITSIGGSGLAVGLVGGLGDSVASILKVFSGYWSDKSGRRKNLVVSGYITSLVSKLLFPLVSVWPYLLILKPMERVGKGLRTAPRDAIIANSTSTGSRGKAFGFHRALDTSGALLGSILAFLFYWFLGLEFRTILLIGAAIGFLSLIPLAPVKEGRTTPREISFSIGLKGLSKDLKIFILIATIFALGNFSYMFFILKSLGAFQQLFPERLAVALPILLYALFNLSYALFSLPIGVLFDRIGKPYVLAIGYSLFALTCMGFMISSSLITFTALFLLYGLFYAFVDGIQRALASDLASKELRGTALGTFHTSIGLATLPASAFAGFLWDINSNMTFIYGAITGLIATALICFMMKRNQQHKIK